MVETSIEKQPYSAVLFWAVILLGVALRMLLPDRGYNYDFESYRLVADVLSAGGNVYRETSRYNYAPLWSSILQGLDAIPWPGHSDFIALRWKVALYLTTVDVGIFLFLYQQYSIKVAALFFLNPISILITGYHAQFDNLAVFIGLCSMALYAGQQGKTGRWLGLIGIGVSLCVKHILFAFPLWLAFKETRWSRKLAVIAVPYAMFLCSFAGHFQEGADGILNNVFLYRSYNNAPFLWLFAPGFVFSAIPKFGAFVCALLLLGLYWREKGPLESLYFYLIAVIIFSSTVANQYFAICIPAIAVLWNWGYALYSAAGAWFLLFDDLGLHLPYPEHLLKLQAPLAYYVLVFMLAAGLWISVFGRKGSRLLYPARWLYEQIRLQVKAPW